MMRNATAARAATRTGARTALAAGLVMIAGLTAACDVGQVADEQGRKLTLVGPAAQTLMRGETNRIVIAVARTGIDGPVTIKFDGLPSGVSIVESKPEIAADASTATFTLHASNDAEVAAKRATVTAVGPGGMSVSERFDVSVTAAK